MTCWLVGALIALLVLVTLHSATAFAEVIDYKLNICPAGGNVTSVKVTSDNMADVLDDGGSVVYTPATDSSAAVLTLTDAELCYVQAADSRSLHIVLVGENSFHVPEDEWAFCINVDGDLEISGQGSMSLKNDFYNPNDLNGNYGFPCIQTEGDLSIRSATIVAESKAGTNAIYCIGDMRISDGAKVKATTDNCPSLWSAGTMTIADSSVEAKAPNGNGI